MKTKLLRLALCAFAALPIGAWGQQAISQTTLWTFDQFQNGDAISSNAVYNYHELYISGHASDKASTAQVSNNSGVSFIALNDNIKFSSISNLYVLGSQNTELKNNRTANQYTPNAVAFKTGVAGTVYVYIKATTASPTRYVNIYEADPNAENSGSTKATKYQTVTTGSAQLVTQSVGANKNIFIGVSAGSYNLYAVKFVPNEESSTNKTITMSDMGLMTFSDTHAWTLPTGLKAYAIRSAVTDGSLTLKEITGTIPACMGVILQGTHGQEYTLTSADVSCYNFNTESAPRFIDVNYALRPVLADYPLKKTYPAGEDASGTSNAVWNNYILAKNGEDMVLALSSGSGNLAAGKAYFSIRQDQINTTSSRELIFFDGDDVTGISNIESTKSKVDNVYYNLNGQRVAQPSKGLYVVNGRKVIIK